MPSVQDPPRNFSRRGYMSTSGQPRLCLLGFFITSAKLSIMESPIQCEFNVKRILSLPNLRLTNEKIPVTEDSEPWRAWDQSIARFVMSVPVGRWLPSARIVAYVAGSHPAGSHPTLKTCSTSAHTSAQPRLPIRLHTSSQNGSHHVVAR
jgi:hypothetical protein